MANNQNHSVFIIKAKENFDAAELCAKKKHYNAWANRAWYSIFQIISCHIFNNLQLQRGKKKFKNGNTINYCYFNFHGHHVEAKFGSAINGYFLAHRDVAEALSTLHPELCIRMFYRHRNISDYSRTQSIDSKSYNSYNSNFKLAYKYLKKNLESDNDKN